MLGTCERLIDLHRERPKVTETEVISELAVSPPSVAPSYPFTPTTAATHQARRHIEYNVHWLRSPSRETLAPRVVVYVGGAGGGLF